MNPRTSHRPVAGIDRLELSDADRVLIERVAELYLPEPRLAQRLRPAAEPRTLRAGGSPAWPALLPGLALAAALVLLLSGFPPPGRKPLTAAESASAAAAAERAASSADWEEHLLFSDVVSQRAGAGGLPPEYRAIETLFFEG